jgi:hypothetical protein
MRQKASPFTLRAPLAAVHLSSSARPRDHFPVARHRSPDMVLLFWRRLCREALSAGLPALSGFDAELLMRCYSRRLVAEAVSGGDNSVSDYRLGFRPRYLYIYMGILPTMSPAPSSSSARTFSFHPPTTPFSFKLFGTDNYFEKYLHYLLACVQGIRGHAHTVDFLCHAS